MLDPNILAPGITMSPLVRVMYTLLQDKWPVLSPQAWPTEYTANLCVLVSVAHFYVIRLRIPYV